MKTDSVTPHVIISPAQKILLIFLHPRPCCFVMHSFTGMAPAPGMPPAPGATAGGGPYSQTWTAGSAAVFDVPAATITGATIACSGITVSEDVTVSTGGTFGTGSTVSPGVATGKTFDFGSQGVSATAGTGLSNRVMVFLHWEAVLWRWFTLNAGNTGIAGVKCCWRGNVFTINGGTICSNASRNLSGKPSQVTINGNFTIGATTGLASSTAIITLDAPMLLGNAVTRTITLGNTAAHVLMVSSVVPVQVLRSTQHLLENWFGRGLHVWRTYNCERRNFTACQNRRQYIACNAMILLNSGGTLQISSNQSLHDLTLNTGSTVTIDAGLRSPLAEPSFIMAVILYWAQVQPLYTVPAHPRLWRSAVQLTSDKGIRGRQCAHPSYHQQCWRCDTA